MPEKPDRIFLSPPHMGGTELKRIREAFDCGYIAPLGPQLAEFERRFSEFTGLPHCLGLSSGTAAMHLALRLSGIGPGDLVLASSLTFIGSVSPVAFLGAEPVFIDSDQATWNMDPDILAQALEVLDKENKRPKAVIPTDLYGQCADYDRILEICDPYGIPVIFDAAESVGATYKNRPAGSMGRASIYSFNGNKIITTSGGGMLASDDKKLMDEARRLSQQARDDAPHYQHSTIGYNYRMSNICAAIGLGQMDVLEQRIAKRRSIFNKYNELLGGVPGVSFMPEAEHGRSNRWLTVLQLDPKAFRASPLEVLQALEAENIESRPVWKPMHMQPVFRDCRMFGGRVCEELFDRGLCLPSGTQLEDRDMERVAAIVGSCAK